jgi:ABC-type Fe3+ transport system substrate-binding protein
MRRLLGPFIGATLLFAGCQAPAAAPAAGPGTQAAATAPAASGPNRTAEVMRLLDAARAAGETELNISWGLGSMGGQEGAAELRALFHRMYGSEFKLNYTPGPSMPDMHAKIAQELAAGQKASSDLLIGNEGNFADLLPREILEVYDYTLLSPRITPELVAVGHIGVETSSTIPAIIFNAEQVAAAAVPATLEGVLEPRWRGLIATTPYAPPMDRVAARPEWGTERMKSFVSRLSQHAGGVIRTGEESRIVSGEFVMFVMGNTHQTRRLQSKGGPLGYVIPVDAAVAGFQHLGVPRNSAHPNLAKLFINMVMSEEGQRIHYEVAFTDHHGLPGSRSEQEVAELKAKGSGIFDIDAKTVLERPDLRQLNAELDRILMEGRGG